MSEHISRKELKQDKIRESFEHGAEAIYSHSRITGIVVGILLFAALGYGGWRLYTDRQNVQASAILDEGMRIYSAPIRTGNEPVEPGELSYADPTQKSQDASVKFLEAANKYPNTNAGKLARYYAALCLEDLDRQNQALEQLKMLDAKGDKTLADLAKYQMATIYARTGKQDEATKLYKQLAEDRSVFVPRPLVLLDMADMLRTSNPAEATNLYNQVKKEFPDSTAADRAERGLGLLSPKS